MSRQGPWGILCLALVGAAAWFGGAIEQGQQAASAWIEVGLGVLRTATLPAGYALVDGDRALLVDAPTDARSLSNLGIKTIENVLLTHHHRDTCTDLDRFLADKVPLLPPRPSTQFITPQ